MHKTSRRIIKHLFPFNIFILCIYSCTALRLCMTFYSMPLTLVIWQLVTAIRQNVQSIKPLNTSFKLAYLESDVLCHLSFFYTRFYCSWYVTWRGFPFRPTLWWPYAPLLSNHTETRAQLYLFKMFVHSREAQQTLISKAKCWKTAVLICDLVWFLQGKFQTFKIK